MDVLICNGLGIYCGMKTLKWLSLKTYKWQGLWNIPTYKYVCRVVLWGWRGSEGQALGHPMCLGREEQTGVLPPGLRTWDLTLGYVGTSKALAAAGA